MRIAVSVAIASTIAGPALAAEMKVTVAIPRLAVAEYHRPYVALWIEKPDQSVAANLAVWYDTKLKNNKGNKWLKDLRQWWRRSGRNLDMPVDGITGASKAPGEHSISFSTAAAPLSGLAAGNYRLVVEAAREVGGREILKIPFSWPPKAAQSLKAGGAEELGAVALDMKP